MINLLPGDGFLKMADLATPHGDEVHQPLLVNPYAQDPEQAKQYENGYQYAQSMGHMLLSQANPEQWRAAKRVWKEGFAEAAEKLGQKPLADALRGPQVSAHTRSNEARLGGLL